VAALADCLQRRPVRRQNVRFGSLADMCGASIHVRFTPESVLRARSRFRARHVAVRHALLHAPIFRVRSFALLKANLLTQFILCKGGRGHKREAERSFGRRSHVQCKLWSPSLIARPATQCNRTQSPARFSRNRPISRKCAEIFGGVSGENINFGTRRLSG
jgi:hypothetical protein